MDTLTPVAYFPRTSAEATEQAEAGRALALATIAEALAAGGKPGGGLWGAVLAEATVAMSATNPTFAFYRAYETAVAEHCEQVVPS